MVASGYLEWYQTIVDHLIHVQFDPGPLRRKFTVLDSDLLIVVITVCLASTVHPVTTDIALTALAAWMMRNSR